MPKSAGVELLKLTHALTVKLPVPKFKTFELGMLIQSVLPSNVPAQFPILPAE
jgi:hypothetical protein